MKTISFVLVVTLLALGCMGCNTCMSSAGPGGVDSGFLFGRVTHPNSWQPGMEHQIHIDRDEIEIIGSVEAEASSYNVFHMVAWGDSGYGNLIEDVKEKGGDGVMNVTLDTRYTQVGPFFVPFYSAATTRLRGVAYKYK